MIWYVLYALSLLIVVRVIGLAMSSEGLVEITVYSGLIAIGGYSNFLTLKRAVKYSRERAKRLRLGEETDRR